MVKKLLFLEFNQRETYIWNYLGALKNLRLSKKEMECIYCVVDLHAVLFSKSQELKNNVLETTASF